MVQTRNKGTPCVPWFYSTFKIQPVLDMSKKGKDFSIPRCPKISRTTKSCSSQQLLPALVDFVNELDFCITSNLNAKGITLRNGKLDISNFTFKFLQKKFNLNKRQWTCGETLLTEFGIDKEMFRRGNPDDKIECVNFRIKFNNQRGIKCFGKNKAGKIIEKIKYGSEKLCFRYPRNLRIIFLRIYSNVKSPFLPKFL